MQEIRFHGRGGQGAVVASKIIATALTQEGNFAQAIPEFGVERRGAPVVAYLRVDSDKIWIRSKIYNPDHLLVLDPTLIDAVDITSGLKKGGVIVINSDKSPEHYKELTKNFVVATVDGSEIAVKNGIGSRTAPIVNTAMLGGLNKALNLVKQETLLEVVRKISPVKPENNVKATQEAYDNTKLMKKREG